MRKRCFLFLFCTILILQIFSISSSANLNRSAKFEGSTSSQHDQSDPSKTTTTDSSIEVTTPTPVDIVPPIDTPLDPTKDTQTKPIPPDKEITVPIPKGGSTPPKNTKPSAKNTLENFINGKNLPSKNSLLVWIDTNAQRTHIFNKKNDAWYISKTFICATGKDSTPTIKGTFKAGAKVSWVYDKKYNCYLKNVTKIYGGYLMHSVILNSKGQVIDGTLGKKKSHGCVRLSIKDSEWIYKNIPIGTTIYIN